MTDTPPMDDQALAQESLKALGARERGRCASIIRDLVTRDAKIDHSWAPVTRAAIMIGEIDLAHEAAYRFANVDLEDPTIMLNAASYVAEIGKVEEAIGMITGQIKPEKADYRIYHFLGTALSQVGKTEDAIAHLRTALKEQPTSGPTWLALAAIRDFEDPEDPEIDTLERLQTMMASEPPAMRGPYQYALGKALGDIGDTDLSYVAYAKGAKLMRRERRFDGRQDKAFINDLMNSHKEGLDTLTQAEGTGSQPIFVTGTPRSGTTLVDQILNRHSKVTNGGELNLLPTAAMEIGGFMAEDLKVYEEEFEDSEAAWKRIADTYLYLARQRFGPFERFVDKSLNTPRVFGLLRTVFPKAPVIWLKRDPLDAAWSCFKTFFPSGIDWSWSFAHIGERFAMEERLFQFWYERCPDQILPVPYEELVEAPKDWIPKILKHCGLEEEEAVYSPHESERTVVTASVIQVQEPINTRSVGASKPFQRHMSDFVREFEAGVKG